MIAPLLRSLLYRPCAALGQCCTYGNLWTYRRQQYVHAGHYFCPRSAFVYISHYCSQSTDGARHTDSAVTAERLKGAKDNSPLFESDLPGSGRLGVATISCQGRPTNHILRCIIAGSRIYHSTLDNVHNMDHRIWKHEKSNVLEPRQRGSAATKPKVQLAIYYIDNCDPPYTSQIT